MKIYLIAGEDSGDLHGANLIFALQKRVQNLQVRGVGGDKMQRAGMSLVAHVKDINFMGFVEVIKHLGTIRRLFRQVEKDIQTFQPDVVILIDYPGFNLRIAPFIKTLGIKIVYYISPQLWAWKKGRVKKIQKWIDKMCVILPFEKDFYANEGVNVDFVGHPLLDEIKKQPIKQKIDTSKTVALLPGSRSQEIQNMLPIMLKVAAKFPQYQFVIAGAPSKTADFYEKIITEQGNLPNVSLKMNETYKVLTYADAALVTSGTATLETALFHVPQVVCYKGSFISYHIGKYLIQVKFISLVNLILGYKAVTELIQYDFTTEKLASELEKLFLPDIRQQILADYHSLQLKLGDVGASDRVADVVLKFRFSQINADSNADFRK